MKQNPNNKNFSGARQLLAAAMLLAMPAVGWTVEGLSYELNVGGGSSDNINRSAENEQEETIGTVGLRFSLDKQSRRFETEVVSDLAYYDYLEGDIESELVGTMTGNAQVTLIDERLRWFVRDSFGQVLGDPFLPSAPENRDNLNYLTSGLTATFAFGSQTQLDLQGSYGLTTYEELELDSNTALVEVGLTRRMSEASSIGVNLRGAQVRYDVASDSDYDVQEAVLRYGLAGGRTEFGAELGYAKLEPEFGEEDDGPIVRLNASRELSSHSSLTFEAGQEFSNSAEAFDAYSAGSPASLDTYGSQQTADPFTHRYANIAWNVAGARTGITLSGSWEDQDYNSASQVNETFTTIGASVRRDLTAVFSAELKGQYGRGEFDGLLGDYSETRLGLELRWQFARTLALAFSYDHGQRDDNSAGNEYRENRYWLTLGFNKGSPQSSLSRREFSGDE